MDTAIPFGRLFQVFASIGHQLSGNGGEAIRFADAEPIALLIASVSLLTICFLGLTVVWPHRDLLKPEGRRASVAPAGSAPWPEPPTAAAPAAAAASNAASAELACHFNEWHLQQHAALSKTSSAPSPSS